MMPIDVENPSSRARLLIVRASSAFLIPPPRTELMLMSNVAWSSSPRRNSRADRTLRPAVDVATFNDDTGSIKLYPDGPPEGGHYKKLKADTTKAKGGHYQG